MSASPLEANYRPVRAIDGRVDQHPKTFPENVAAQFGGVEYFDVSTDGETIVLRPLESSRADEVRTRLEQPGITEQDVSDAISWERQACEPPRRLRYDDDHLCARTCEWPLDLASSTLEGRPLLSPVTAAELRD